MHVTAILATLLGSAIVGSTAPSARATSITSDCTDLSLNRQWLIGNCLKDDGATRIQSSVYLGNKVMNSEALLVWNMNWNAKENTTLSLDDHISNYNGHLLSDLSGTPSIPINDSTFPIPSSFTYGLSLSNTNCSSGAAYAANQYLACFAYHPATVTPFEYSSFAFTSNSGWQITAYDNVGCEGTPLGTSGPGDVGKCMAFAKKAVAFSAEPLWNAD